MTKKRLLVIEDEPNMAKQLKWGLPSFDIVTAKNPKDAIIQLRNYNFKVITLDLGLPPHPDTPVEGFKLLGKIKKISPHSKIIVITGNTERENALKAIAEGAFDFCEKPVDLKVLTVIVDRAFRVYDLEEENRKLHLRVRSSHGLANMLGTSPSMQQLFSTIRKISPSDYPVLIEGESGTGKEMIAKAIHSLSNRKKEPFIIINCGAIPENLLESELFGYEKGAFTGASTRKIGKLERANKGSAFLDEVGELPLSLQVKLLRFLQEGTIERLGGDKQIQLDVRIIAATNTRLKEAVKKGRFREDLYFRLNVLPLSVPPLRERGEDILLLARHFLDIFSYESKKGNMRFTPGALKAMLDYPWPGNVRELENVIKRAVVITEGKLIGPEHLSFMKEASLEILMASTPDTITPDIPLTLKQARSMAEREALKRALMLTKNNISQAAKILDVSRPTIHDLIKKHKIRT